MDRVAGMTGPEHYLAGEYALQQAELIRADAFMHEGQVNAQAAWCHRAQAHFAAARTLAIGVMVANSETGEAAEQWQNLLGAEAVDA